MNEKGLDLFKRFQSILGGGKNEEESFKFFSSLSKSDYDILIDIFDINDNLEIDEATRDKIMDILIHMREQFHGAHLKK